MPVQPVATLVRDPVRSRTPGQIMSAFGRGDLIPSSISPSEQGDLLTWARHKRHKLTYELLGADSTGSVRQARRAIRDYRTPLAVRLIHLWEATPPEYRPSAHDTPEEAESKRQRRLDEVFARAPAVSNLQRPAEGRLRFKSKGGGCYRPILSFGWSDTARFEMLAASVKSFAGFHASQFQLHPQPGSRGQQAACGELLTRLNGLRRTEAAAGGGREADQPIFVELDVRDFFGSVSEDWCADKPILDGDMRCQIYTGRMRIKADRKVRGRIDGAFDDWVRRGLPQGSALSALIAEWVMADVLGGLPDLPDEVGMITYCDNIGLIGPRGQIDAVVELIREVFRISRAGPFSLLIKQQTILSGPPFRFLGMEFAVEDHWVIRPPTSQLVAVTLQTRTDLDHAFSGACFARIRRKVQGKAAAWSRWHNARHWAAEMLLEVRLAESRARGLNSAVTPSGWTSTADKRRRERPVSARSQTLSGPLTLI